LNEETEIIDSKRHNMHEFIIQQPEMTKREKGGQTKIGR